MDAGIDDKVDDVDLFLDWEPRLKYGPTEKNVVVVAYYCHFFLAVIVFRGENQQCGGQL